MPNHKWCKGNSGPDKHLIHLQTSTVFGIQTVQMHWSVSFDQINVFVYFKRPKLGKIVDFFVKFV